MKQLVKWLYPGLRIKRWMLLFSVGLLLLVFGAALILNYQIFGALEDEILYIVYQVTGSYSYAFLVFSGFIFCAAGIIVMLVAVRKLIRRFLEFLAPDQKEVSKSLLSHMELARGTKVVAIGGGHGLSMVLRGLKNKTSNITAIVTVADDGGSSGRLRQEMGIIAPGDLRNCLVALADKESILEEVFQYRFGGEGELAGHSVGNLFLAALIKEFGGVRKALEAASKVLNIRGQVMPSTEERIRLCAKMSDGKIVTGESEISAYAAHSKRKVHITHLTTIPEDPTAVKEALEAVRQADVITVGPGSLYTSILPNLLVPDLLAEIRNAAAPCIYICNVMTQPGETDNFSVSDHLKTLIDHIGPNVIDVVIANNGKPSKATLDAYAKVGSVPVKVDRRKVERMGVTPVEADLLGEKRGPVQDATILAEEILRISNLLHAKIPREALEEYLRRNNKEK